jgi:hypothetical protein
MFCGIFWSSSSETETSISGFLDFIHRLVFEGTRRFGNWICFRPQVKGGGGVREEDTYSVGPLRKS